jgi:hypothetical protein
MQRRIGDMGTRVGEPRMRTDLVQSPVGRRGMIQRIVELCSPRGPRIADALLPKGHHV